MYQLQGQRGYTLVELTVVLALAAVVATIAYPQFSRWVESQRLNRDARQILSVMQTARAHAVEKGVTVVVMISTTPSGRDEEVTAFVDSNGNLSQDSDELPLSSIRPTDTITIPSGSFHTPSGGSASFTAFDNRGLSVGRSGQFRLEDRFGKAVSIELGPAGNVAILRQ